MTPEEQRIAIARECPFVEWAHNGRTNLDIPYWRPRDGDSVIPFDPLNDLNAVQAAIFSQGLGDSEELDFVLALERICDPHSQDEFATICATAAQRAEALLKVKGLWKQ